MTDRVVAYVPDLMDRSRLGGHGLEFVADVERLSDAAADASLVIVDLARPGALEAASALARAGAHVLGFAPHVDTELRAAALDAGVRVLPRSRFFSSVDAWMRSDG